MKALSIALILLVVALQAAGQVVINEFMANNASTVRDEHVDYDDWVEIYNAGNQAVDLAGFHLTDDSLKPAKFCIPMGFPSVTTIAPHCFLVIWCDNEGRDGPLHANFKLSGMGEFVGIVGPGTANGAAVAVEAQVLHAAFGLYPNPTAQVIRSMDGTCYSLFNVSGQLVGRSDANGVADMPLLAPGLYVAVTPDGALARMVKQ